MKKMALINTKLEKNNIYIIELNNAKKRNPLSLELIKSLQNEFDYIKNFEFNVTLGLKVDVYTKSLTIQTLRCYKRQVLCLKKGNATVRTTIKKSNQKVSILGVKTTYQLK